MDTNSELYRAGLLMHGHRCPAMPLGLRAGLAALEALGVERSRNGELRALVEIDRSHCGTCFADGIQIATGCTFGKGNIERLGYGKFSVTVIDNRAARSVRVVARPEVMRRSQESEFIAERRKGIPACQIDPRLSEELVNAVLSEPVEALFRVEPVTPISLVEIDWQQFRSEEWTPPSPGGRVSLRQRNSSPRPRVEPTGVQC